MLHTTVTATTHPRERSAMTASQDDGFPRRINGRPIKLAIGRIVLHESPSVLRADRDLLVASYLGDTNFEPTTRGHR